MIKNLFALVGFVVVVATVLLGVKAKDIAASFDPKAPAVYLELAENVLKTKSAAEATIWKVPVADDLSADEVEEAMKLVANELNIAHVAELPLYKDVAAKLGKEYRYVKIFMFCNSLTAAKMLDYNDAFSAYLPCRITLIEDKSGKLWLVSLNMDLMIYGGAPLPPALKEESIRVKEIILEVMNRAAEGEF
ncbi:MAG: DUF302 domain-containing protein [Sedimenticola sp.]